MIGNNNMLYAVDAMHYRPTYDDLNNIILPITIAVGRWARVYYALCYVPNGNDGECEHLYYNIT